MLNLNIQIEGESQELVNIDANKNPYMDCNIPKKELYLDYKNTFMENIFYEKAKKVFY